MTTLATVVPSLPPSLIVVEPVPIRVCEFNFYRLRAELSFNRQGIPPLATLDDREAGYLLAFKLPPWELQEYCPGIAAAVFRCPGGMYGIRLLDSGRLVRTTPGGYPGRNYYAITPHE